jgi:hypothetical protein
MPDREAHLLERHLGLASRVEPRHALEGHQLGNVAGRAARPGLVPEQAAKVRRHWRS